jgi:hypothetical protein
MIKNLARLDNFRRPAPARIAPAQGNDNRPALRHTAPVARHLVCRWRVSAATGQLECRWLIEAADEASAEVPILRSARQLMHRLRASAAA